MATRLSTLLNEAPSLRALGDQLKRIGEQPEACFYTADHYVSFKRITH